MIGAGLAGLAAADELIARGKRVAVVEARDRVGGRVRATDVDGVSVDSGGQWITPGNESMLELVREAGLDLVGPQEGSYLLRTGGSVVRSHQQADRTPALSPFETADLGQGVVRFRRLSERMVTDPTWTSTNKTWLNQPLSRWIKTNVRTPAAQQDFSTAMKGVLGAEADSGVTLGAALRAGRNGIDLESLFAVGGGLKLRRVLGGMHQVADHLGDQVGDRIQFGVQVTGITQAADRVIVHTASGEQIEARTTLVTLPPWLAMKLDYSPGLPEWRYETVARTSPGAAIKAFVVYPTPWWRESGLSGQMSADDGTIRATFDLTEPGGPGVLTGMFGGKTAVAMSQAGPAAREQAFIDALAAVFGQVARQEHSYLDHDWYADPFTQGSNTPHFAPGIWSMNGQLLAQAEGPIHFAGSEYAHKFNGYLEGAIRSGRDEARAIARELG
ncbi:NAD(P)/FAD-dependent oxidoreductase [Propionimicrobium sp. PCR01-08-3]|uniref:flavin monoamine oxidase family protein n=1 Tax=Propionimicrobium sp. PCR01-08-3 TaxID=3052086 RepID=UPI00255C9F16|nr:NAD(P)/FAD-dependent oxidoreductase [Propionimicrobium sp. PCR01-08-3]WIY82074.1 NAD(P)/FAD-dependent oxidoreductase [Propionimicrobium sp. PCR01-08-3]